MRSILKKRPAIIIYTKCKSSSSDILTGIFGDVQEDFQCDEIYKVIDDLISQGYEFTY